MEERIDNIPEGYSFIKYERDSSSYIVEDGDTVNSGIIRASQSPAIEIHNKRGFGLTAKKIWSDKDFMNSYEDIYIGVYANGSLVSDSVRKLSYPKTSVYYYWDELEAPISAYEIREVSLTGDVVINDGVVSGYTSVTPINPDDTIEIHADAVEGGEGEFSYVVTYEKGAVTGFAHNVRTDKIHNTRAGLKIIKQDFNHAALAGAEFLLTKDGEPFGAGTYTSGTNGVITTLYPQSDVDYVLTETETPGHYYGIDPITIRSVNGEFDISGTADYELRQTQNGNELIIKNRPYTVKAKKIDGDTKEPVEGAHFALYREINGIPDYRPIAGYEDLVTGADGLIPLITESLYGGYFLRETTPASGYNPLESDIYFNVSDNGRVTAEGCEVKETYSGNTLNFMLEIPNYSYIDISITKRVVSTFDFNDEFTFTLDNEYEITKNGVTANGRTFKLSDGETATVSVPLNQAVLITEAIGHYKTTWSKNGGAPVAGNQMSFTADSPTNIVVTNEMNPIVPSNVKTRFLPFIGMMAAGILFIIMVEIKRKLRKLSTVRDSHRMRSE